VIAIRFTNNMHPSFPNFIMPTSTFARTANRLCLIACAVACVGGCDSGPKLVPISGRVTIDGKPLERGAMTVWVAGYRPSCSAIGKDGRFALTTHKTGDGCPVGDFAVTVTSETSTKGDIMTYDVPLRYKDPVQSKLRIQADQPCDDWEINLNWAGDPHGGPYHKS
jgi:hypothetical protein